MASQAGAESVEIFILGSVENPGKYEIEKSQGVLDLVVKAGGIRPEGRDLAIKREIEEDTEVYELNPGEMIRRELDIRLKDGDIVFAMAMSFNGLFGKELEDYNQQIIDFTRRDPKLFVDIEDFVEPDGVYNPRLAASLVLDPGDSGAYPHRWTKGSY